MPHSWIAYDVAKEIVDSLVEGGLVEKRYADVVRGIIQIKIEDKYRIYRISPG